MFSEMIHEFHCGKKPDMDILQKRFDAAMTKKLGVVKLPPTFWIQDAKINPRADHLFWAAVVIGDQERLSLALSVIAVELAEKSTGGTGTPEQESAAAYIQSLIKKLLGMVNDTDLHRDIEMHVQRLLPQNYSDDPEVNR